MLSVKYDCFLCSTKRQDNKQCPFPSGPAKFSDLSYALPLSHGSSFSSTSELIAVSPLSMPYHTLKKIIIISFIILLVVPGHCCSAQTFSSCARQSCSSSLYVAFSLPWLLLLQSTGSRAHGLSTVAHRCSCSVACGIFLDQGSNLCHLHWQSDS